MDLHIALRALVSNFGKGIFSNPKLGKLLEDLNAFEGNQSEEFIFNAIIENDYLDKLLSIGSWNEKSIELLKEFIFRTGFQSKLVEDIFQCIAYSLDWKKSISKDGPSNITAIDNSNSYANINTNVEDMTEKEFERFIGSKIEWDHKLEEDAGLLFSNYYISEFNGYTGFKILFEVHGKMIKDTLSIRYTVYDKDGRLRNDELVGFFTKSSPLPPVSEFEIFFNKSLDLLGKVIIYGSYE